VTHKLVRGLGFPCIPAIHLCTLCSDN
jgi:hypothetical protein